MASNSWGSIGQSAGSIFSTWLQSRANSQATKAQSEATAQALQFEREREEARRRRYEEAMKANEQQWAAYDATRNALLGRYGIDIADPGSYAQADMPPEGQGG